MPRRDAVSPAVATVAGHCAMTCERLHTRGKNSRRTLGVPRFRGASLAYLEAGGTLENAHATRRGCGVPRRSHVIAGLGTPPAAEPQPEAQEGEDTGSADPAARRP